MTGEYLYQWLSVLTPEERKMEIEIKIVDPQGRQANGETYSNGIPRSIGVGISKIWMYGRDPKVRILPKLK